MLFSQKLPPGKLEKNPSRLEKPPPACPPSLILPLAPLPWLGADWAQIYFFFFPDILQTSGHSLPEPILRGCFFHPRLNLSGFGDCRIRRFLQQGVLQIPFFPPWKFRVQISVCSPLPRGLCISPIPPSSSLLRRGREEKKNQNKNHLSGKKRLKK